MSFKLPKSTLPNNHSAEDFKCCGPPALEDGKFDDCKIADFGCFSQEKVDSNKYYCAMIAQSKINQKWFTYFEWGRVGTKIPQFQFIECNSEAEAKKEFVAQCHEKNDKRGIWTTIAGIKTLMAKPGKDVYLVRQLTTRSTGLPDAKTIKYSGSNITVVVKNNSNKRIDIQTAKLLQDISIGTINYTRASMADSSLPTQTAIDQARQIIFEAQKRIIIVGNNLNNQIADNDLRNYSAELYRRIAKIKPVGTPDSIWILSENNIVAWLQDLDAFESALTSSGEISDPFHGLPLHMEWIDPKTELGQFLHYWWPKATGNKHSYLKEELKIKNLWKIDRHGDDEKFNKSQERIHKELNGRMISERPLFQPSERPDVVFSRKEIHSLTNSALLHHATRSVNLKGILEKSLMLPKQLVGVIVNGKNFGQGCYFADDVKKSAGYSSLKNAIYTHGSGSIPGRSAFMFVADVVLGKPHVATRVYGYTSVPGCDHSIFAVGSNYSHKHSGVQNNEWIVFDDTQFRLKYLVEFDV